MHRITVKTENGEVVLLGDQAVDPKEYRAFISLHPEQVDLLVKWIEEAKNELLRQ